MKYLKRFNKINESYDFKLNQSDDKKRDEVNYFFNDEFNNRFKVTFLLSKNKKTSELVYQQYNKYTEEWDMEVVSKKKVLDDFIIKKSDNIKVIDGEKYIIKTSNIYKILKTVFNSILKNFISNNEWCSIIKIIGSGKSIEKEQITQRTKVYVRYFKNHPIDGWTMVNVNNMIFLKKKT
jgi:hypothetical protein